ncbi:hypothetical protein [Romboutsia sp.]|uniref:hypothetical protein n=1 Tax=Romboutsia sp. TaxID=1965302 RepID=UPI003F3B9CB9
MLNKDNEIISNLMLKEIQIVVDKYYNMDNQTKEKIKSILSTLKDNNLKSYLINNPNKITEIVKETNVTEINEDVITLFSWLNLEGNKTSIKDTIAYYEEIKKNNYIKIGRYTISKTNERTKDDTKKEIEERIKDKSFLERAINKNKLADIWINQSIR